MSLSIEEGSFERKVVRGEIHYQEHVSGVEPPNALTVYGGPKDKHGLGLRFDAVEVIRVLMSLPHDRRTARDLTFYRTDRDIHPDLPPATIYSGALEWTPTNELVMLRIGSIPFSPDNTITLLQWLEFQCQPWDERREVLRKVPFSFSDEEHTDYLNLQQFLEDTYPNPKRYNMFKVD